MAKAELKFPNGTHVQIEGTSEEVGNLLKLYSSSNSKTKRPRSKTNTSEKKRVSRTSPTTLIKELIKEDYFKGHKRSLSDIQKKFEERGHIYAQTSLSTPLTRLTRNRTLRRIKDKKGWMYVL